MKNLYKLILVIFLLIMQIPTIFVGPKQNTIQQIDAATVMPSIPTVRNEVSGTSINVATGATFLSAYTNVANNVINFTADISLTPAQVSSMFSSIVNRNLKINGNGHTLNVDGNDLFNFGNTATTTFHLQNIVLNKTSGNNSGYMIRGGGANADFILENISKKGTSLQWFNIGWSSDQSNIFFRGTIGQLPHNGEYWEGVKVLVFEENSTFTDTMGNANNNGDANFYSPTAGVNAKVYFGRNSTFYAFGMNNWSIFLQFAELNFYNGSNVTMEKNGGTNTGVIQANGVSLFNVNIDTNASLTLNNLGNGWALYDNVINTQINVNPGGSLVVTGDYTGSGGAMAFGSNSSKVIADNPKLLDIRTRSIANKPFAVTPTTSSIQVINSNIALWENNRLHTGTPTAPTPFTNATLSFGSAGLGPTTTTNTFSTMPGGFNQNKYSRLYAIDTASMPTVSVANMNLLVGQSMSVPIIYTPVNATVTYSNYDPTIISFTGNTLNALKSGNQTVTATVTDFIGYSSTTTFQVITTYPAPTLTINPQVVTLVLNAPSPNLLTGVSGKDYQGNDLITTTSGNVDTSTEGIYVITYTTIDSYLNQTTATRSYIVGSSASDQDYAVLGNDFVGRLGTIPSDFLTRPAYIATSNNIRLYQISTGQLITFDPNDSNIYKILNADVNNQLKHAVGSYPLIHQITYNGATINLFKQFTIESGNVPVINTQAFETINVGSSFDPNNNVIAIDTEDSVITSSLVINSNVNINVAGLYTVSYSVSDSDFNTTTFNKVVLVTDNTYTVGNDYILQAFDFEKRISQVNTSDNAIISSAKVKLFSKTTGLEITDGVTVNSGLYKAEVGDYDITYFVTAEPTLSVNKKAIVSSGQKPIITGATFAEGLLNGTYTDMDNISATDTEDGDITYKVVLDKNVDVLKAGITKVTYSVTDSDGNTATLERIVLINDGAYVVGETTIIEAHDFIKRISEVITLPEAVTVHADAKQYSKVTGLEVVPPVIENLGGYSSIDRVYTITFKGLDNQTMTINATVTKGNIPSLLVPELTEITVGGFFDPYENVSVSDTDGGVIPIDYTRNYSTTVAGVYSITYSVTDIDGNTASKIQTLVVNDGSIFVGINYIIKANSFSKRVSEVDTQDTVIINAANVSVYDKLGQLIIKPVSINKGVYTNIVGIYPITFSVSDELSTSTTINANVHNGNVPTITGTDFINLSTGSIFDPLNGVNATDIEDGNLNAFINVSNNVDTNTPGFYTVVYNVTDNDFNTTTHLRVVLINDGNYVIGDNFVIHANSYTIRVSQIDNSDTAMITKSNVKVYDKHTGALTQENVTIDKDNYYTSGTTLYNPIYKVTAEQNTQITSQIDIIEGNIPIISGPSFTEVTLNSAIDIFTGITYSDNEDSLTQANISVLGSINTAVAGIYKLVYTVTDSDLNQATHTRIFLVNDGNSIVSDTHIISATDFTKRLSEVNTSDAAIISAANAKIYSKITGLEDSSIIITAKGGYQAIQNQYTITFKGSNNDAQISIIANVINGESPIITAPSYKEINVGDTFNPLENSSATDLEDGVLSLTNSTTFTTSIAGVYVITYSAIDSDLNQTTHDLVLLVKDPTFIVGDNFIIKATDFSKRISEVDISDAAILNAANVLIYNKTTGLLVVEPLTINKGTYQNIPNIYDINFTLNNDNKATITIKATVLKGESPTINGANFRTININDSFDPLENVNANDLEDGNLTNQILISGFVNPAVAGVYQLTYSISDSDFNTTEVIRSIVVNDGSLVIGTNYIIEAKDFTKRVSQVDTQDSAILNDAQVKVYDKLTGLLTSKNVLINKGSYSNTPNTYSITYSVEDELTTITTKNANVITGNIPILSGPTYSEITLNSPFDYAAGISVSDVEDTLTYVNIVVTGNVVTNVAGLYPITYTVTDSDLNQVTLQRVVLVNDGNFVTGTNFIIKATDFTRRVSQVDASNDALISAANVQVFNKTTGAILSSKVTNTGGYTNAVNQYSVTFSDASDEVSITIVANVVAGNMPLINAPDVSEISLGESFDEFNDVFATDVEDSDISNKITQNNAFNINIPGVYTLNYTVIDSDLNSVSKTRILIVNDSSFVVGDTYIIRAHNFTIRVADVVTLETAIKLAANVQVYDKLTGVLVATPVSVNDGGYTNIPQTYNITFSILSDSSASITINGIVIGGNPPIINGANYLEINVNDSFNSLSGVSASDIEDSDLTSVINVTGSVNNLVSGVYTLVYSVVDTDSNITTKTRVIVVKDNNIVSGTNFIIQASDFTKRISEVNISDNVIIDHANIKVYSKIDGSLVNENLIINKGSYTNIVNTYPMTYSLVSEPTTSISKNATVINGNTPVLTAPSFTEIALNSLWDNSLGITVSDIEDILTYANVIVTGNVNTSVAGLYTLTYSVMDSDFNTVTKTRVILVNDGTYIGNSSHIIKANDFTKLVSEVNTNNESLIIAANAKIYSKTTGLEDGSVIVQNDGGYTNIPNQYTITFKGATNDVTISVVATVLNGNIPSLNTDSYKEINVNDSFNPLTNAIATDVEDGDISANIQVFGNYNLNTPGVYPLTYSITDSDLNTVTNNFVLVIKDSTFISGTNFIIRGHDFNKLISTVNTQNTAILNDAKVEVFSKTTGLLVTEDISIDKGTYTNIVGVYQINFTLTNDSSASITINATVGNGNAPTISGVDYLELNLNETFNYLDGVVASDIEDFNISKKITVSGNVNFAVAGVYSLKYTVIDSDFNKTEVLRSVLVKDGTFIVGDKYIIKADNFIKRISAVNTNDAAILEHANVQVFDKQTGLLTLETVNISKSGYSNIVGFYPLTYSVARETSTKITKTAIVTSGDNPIISGPTYTEINVNDPFDYDVGISVSDTEDTLTYANVIVNGSVDSSTPGVYTITYTVTDSDFNSTSLTRVIAVNDGTFVYGADFIISAHNFTKNFSQVDISDNSLILAADVKIYSKETGLEVVGAKVSNKGGYTNTPNQYSITFSNANDSVSITIIAEVVAGNIPNLVSPTYKELVVGTTFDQMLGVSANDIEDNDITNKVIPSGFVDINTPGVYTMNYSVTDSDLNTVKTKQIVVVIDSTIKTGTNYIISANNFTKRVGEVDTQDTSIINFANVRVYDKVSAQLVLVPLTVNKGTYSNTIGIYPIEFVVTSDPTTKITINANVISGNPPIISGADYKEINVNDIFDPKANVSANDLEDLDLTSRINITGYVNFAVAGVYNLVYSVIDNDFNQTNVTRVIVVKNANVTIGTNYIIVANSFERRISQVDTSDEAIIMASNVIVYDKASGAITNTAVNINKGNYTATVGTYAITYSIINDATITISAKVVVGEKPLLSAPSFSEIAINSTFDPISLVNATDLEDGNIKNIITIVTNDVDTSTAGIYRILYSVTDSDLNTVTLERIVLVNDSTYVVGNKYIIEATDFSKRVSEVNTSNNAIINDAKVKVYSSKTGILVSTPTISNNGGYSQTPNTYNITFTSPENDVSITIIATVTRGNLPILTAPSFNEITVGSSFDPMKGVAASDIEDTNLNDVVFSGHYDVTIPGVYTLNYQVTDSDNNTVTRNQILVVNDGFYVSGDDYIISAHNFTKRLNEVVLDDTNIINSSNVIVYNKHTGERAFEEIDVDSGNYHSEIGTYSITFFIPIDLKARETIDATVTSGEAPVISGVNRVQINVGDSFDALANVFANDAEDLDISHNIKITGAVSPNKQGVYILNYSVTDSDSNTVNVSRVVIVTGTNVVVDNNYAIVAHDFDVRVDLVDFSDAFIKDKSQVQVYDLNTGLLVVDPFITIDKGIYTNAIGTYDIKLSFNPEIIIKVNVLQNMVPIITALFTEIPLGGTFDPMSGLSIIDVEDGDISKNAVINNSVNTNVAGFYKVMYEITDSYGNKASKERIVLVKDSHYNSDGDFIIFAKDYSIDAKYVTTAYQDVITYSNLAIYSKETGALLNVTHSTEASEYTNKQGIYKINISYGNTSKQIYANVTSDGILVNTGLLVHSEYILVLGILISSLFIIFKIKKNSRKEK